MDRRDQAIALKSNPVFREILEKMYALVDVKELTADPTDELMCQALVITRQQIAQLQKNINFIIDDEEAKLILESKPEVKVSEFKR